MNRLLSKFRKAEMDREHEAMIAKAVLEACDPEPVVTSGPALKPGDRKRLRGIPVVGTPGGLGGAIAGTRPDQLRHRTETWESR